MSSNQRILRAICRALLLAAPVFEASSVYAQAASPTQELREFDIKPQALTAALLTFSKQADRQIVGATDALRSLSTQGVSGRLPIDQAISKLLSGTGLTYEFVGQHSIRILTAAWRETSSGGADVTNVSSANMEYPSDQESRSPRNDQPSATQEQQPVNLADDNTVMVIGYRSAYAGALAAKRDANQVIDVISAEEIGQFPDQNVSEAIQRVSGVSITRNNGEGESVTIRGLSPAFTRIEIDGRTTSITADSSDPERQSVLSTFASDLYSEIEVVKSPTAADVEGGIGGTVRLSTPDPLKIGKLRYGITGGSTLADKRDNPEPTVQGFFSNVFADQTIGVLLTATYDDLDRRLDKIQNSQNWIAVTSADLNNASDPALQSLIGARYPGELRQEQRAGDRDRLNLNGKLEFQPTTDLNLYVNGLYVSDNRLEDRSRIMIDWTRGMLTGGTLDAASGTLTDAQFVRQRTDLRQFKYESDITSKGLIGGGTWSPGEWKINAEASYTKSEEDQSEYRVDSRVNADGPGGYDLGDPRFPSIYTAAANADPAALAVQNIQLSKRVISLEEKHIKFDIERKLSLGPISGIQIGARYAPDRYDRLQGTNANPGRGLTYADAPVPHFGLDGSFGQGAGHNLLSRWPSVDPLAFYNEHPPTTPFTYNDENLYSIEEKGLAGYGMANFDTPIAGTISARGNLGARVVRTQYVGDGRINVDTGSGEVLIDDAPDLKNTREDVLPALNIVLSGASEQSPVVRAAVTRALTRPTISQISPGIVVNVPDSEIERGNPDLKPFLAWQYDLGVEWYFGRSHEGLLSAALFAKDVDNFIVPNRFTATLGFPEANVAEHQFIVDSYRNGGAATIRGVELNFQSPFSFLPKPFDGFGIYANYTFTDSDFTDENGHSYTFPGASKNTFNIVGYYEMGGFSTRLAYNYRDDYLITPSTEIDGSNAIYGENQGRLDFALRYRFTSGVRLSFDAQNITGEQHFEYYDIPSRLNDIDVEGRIYSFSVGYVF